MSIMLLPTCSVNYPNASSTSYGTCAEIWISRLSLWTKKRLKVKAKLWESCFKVAACVLWLLTDDGCCCQLALVHTINRAVGDHGATCPDAMEYLSRLNQCFARQAALKFTVSLRETGKAPQLNKTSLTDHANRYKMWQQQNVLNVCKPSGKLAS